MDPTPALLQQCAPQVAPATVAAIIRTESGGNPLAININHRKARLARRATSTVEAVGWAKWLIQHGYNIDMGLMQVNSNQLQRLKVNVDYIFDPCMNIKVGSYILTQNYLKARDQYGHGQNALFASLSAYNTGRFDRGFRNGYVARVIQNAGKPVTIQSVSQHPPFAHSASSSSSQLSAKHTSKHHRTAHTASHSHHAHPQASSLAQGQPSPYDAPTAVSGF